MGCSCSQEAPNLDRYFKVLEEDNKATGNQLDDIVSALALAMDAEGTQQKQQEQYAKLRPIIANAFDHHDTNSDGILDADESRAFFEHYIERFVKHSKAMGRQQARQSQTIGLRMMGGLMEGGMAKEMQDAMQQQAKIQIKQTEKMIDDALKEYRAKETQYNQAAFSLLDENKDGKLVKEVIVEALLPGTLKNLAFSNCFPTGPEAMMQKAMGQMAAAIGQIDQECNQQ